MGKTTLLLSVLLVGLQSSAAFCYQPLINSEWAANHPDQLPIPDECRITSTPVTADGIEFQSVDSPDINGASFLKKNTFLSCTSKQLQVAFSIPISNSLITFPALGVGVPSFKRIAVNHLEGKRVSDLFRSYGGFKAGATYCAGGSAGVYINSKGVNLTTLDLSFGGKIEAGFSKFTISRRKSKALYKLYQRHSDNPFVITSQKLIPSEQTDFPSFLTRSELGNYELKTQSGHSLVLGNLGAGCTATQSDLNAMGGILEAKLLKINRNCSIVVEFSDGTVILQGVDQDNNTLNAVLRDPAAEEAFGKMTFVKPYYVVL